MSPTAFQHLVTDLVAHLHKCRQLCDRIYSNRHISRENGNLENLRAGLKTCSNSIWFEFNALRNIVGSRLDLGDDTARHSLKRNISDLESHVEARLRDIEHRRNEGPPSFRDILRRVERIEEKAKTVLIDLGRRLECKPAGKPAHKPAVLIPIPHHKTKSPKPKKIEGAIVSVKERDNLRWHLMNSWEERLVGGMILYVNCQDETRTQWSKPEGFIKPLPRHVHPVMAQPRIAPPLMAPPLAPPVWQQPAVVRQPVRDLVRMDPLSPYRLW
jgi:hypothetical protein